MAGDDLLIIVTRLRLISPRHLPHFLWLSMRAVRQARAMPGFRGLRLLIDRRLAFWTATAWTDEAAMRRYRGTGAHRAAMPAMAGWCDEGVVVRFIAPIEALGDWRGAHARLLADGTPTPLPCPSPGQLARIWAPPRLSRLTALAVRPPRRLWSAGG